MTNHDPSAAGDAPQSSGNLILARPSGSELADPYGPRTAYDPGRSEFRSFAFDVQECLRIFFKHRLLVAGMALCFVAVGAVYASLHVPVYTASARLQIDRTPAKIVEGGHVASSEEWDYDYLKTEYERLQSLALAKRVVSNLKLADDPDFLKPRRYSIRGLIADLFRPTPSQADAPIDKASLKLAAAGVVQGHRRISPVVGTRMVDITYSDPDPGRAQRIVMAYANAYIASNLDKRFEANAYAKAFLQDQLQQLKLRLQTSEKAMLDFAEKEQIIVVSEKSPLAESNLANATAALDTVVSERIKSEQLWKQVQATDAVDLPQFLENRTIRELRSKRNELVADYQQKLETFKPDYPAMVQISNRISEVDRQLAQEIEALRNSFKASYESTLSQETEMKGRIRALRSEVLDLQKRSIQYNILKREVDTNRSLYEGLLQRYKEIDVAGGAGANNVFIVDEAERPGSPSSPNISKALLLSLGLGLGFGFAAAFLVENLDDTIRTPEEIDRITGLVTLGLIPKLEKDEQPEQAFEDPRSQLSEAYQALCTSLQLSTPSGLPKVILVTSATPGEGKSLTSLAVARHFAARGLKVLLIDADLRNASLHDKLGVDNSLGLSNYLTGACTPPETFQKTAVENLALMTSGPMPQNAAELLGGPRLQSLLTVGLKVFDLVIIDSPPVMGLADALILSDASDATVFAVAAGQVRIGAVREAMRRLRHARSPIVGAVLTKIDIKNGGYGYGYGYGYGFGYGYGYGYGAESKATGSPAAVKSLAKPVVADADAANSDARA